MDWNAKLRDAVQESDYGGTIWAIRGGADANVRDGDGDPILVSAFLSGDLEIVRLLLDAGADPNTRDGSGCPLLRFVPIKAAEVLIEAGANPNASDSVGSLLNHAVFSGDEALVKVLVNAGASVVGGEEDQSSLHLAAEAGSIEIVRILLTGSDVCLNSFDELDYTPLCWAAYNGDVEMARLFIEAGADINCHNGRRAGETALNVAVENSKVDVVALLLQFGASISVPGWMGNTAMDRAERLTGPNGKKIREMLESQSS